MKCSPDTFNFPEEISSLFHSLFSSVSAHYSFKKAFLSLLAILLNSSFSLVYLFLSPLPFTSLFSSFLSFFQSLLRQPLCLLTRFFGMVLVIATCTVLWTSFHSSSGTLLPDLILCICSPLLLYNCKGCNSGHT